MPQLKHSPKNIENQSAWTHSFLREPALCLLLVVLSSEPSGAIAGDILAESKADWRDPFVSIQQEWFTLDGYEKKMEEELRKLAEAQKEPDPPPRIETVWMPGVRLNHIIPSQEQDVFDQDVRKDWMTVDEANEELAERERAQKLRHAFGTAPYDIRYAALPFNGYRAIPAPRVSRPVKDRDGLRADEKKKAEEQALLEKKTKEAKEAYEALSAYRRRQLEAIESDRQTLAALQDALNELGLSEELDFMTQKKKENISAQATASGK